MKKMRLGLIGFGNVGQGLALILRDFGEAYRRDFGVDFSITAVADAVFGGVDGPDGLDPAALLEAAAGEHSFKRLPGYRPAWDALTMIRESATDAIVEMSFTDLKTGEPATAHVRAALQLKKHVATTNKGPAALHFDELEALARDNGVGLGVEGTVMSGTPALRLGREILSAAGVRRVQGIFNGTTNFILTRMEAGADYEDALEEAQRLGYAEADPTGDVEGFDAAGKVVILAHLLMKENIRMEDVDRTGITGLRLADIESARAAGERWKLIGSLERGEGGALEASVKPLRLPVSHPLAGVGGAANAIHYTTDLLGEVTLIGPGAGRLATGYAVIQDLLALA